MLRLRSKHFLHRRTTFVLVGSICLCAGLVGCGASPAPSPAENFDPAVQEQPTTVSATPVAASTSTSIPARTPSPQPAVTRTTTTLSESLIGARPVFTASDTLSPAPEFDPRPTPILTPTLLVVEPVSPLEPVQDQAPRPDSSELVQSPLPTPAPVVEETVQADTPSSPPAQTITIVVTPLAPDLADLRQEMINAINVERQVEGLPPYQVDETLTTVAQAHADDMARRGYMDHITPEGKTYTDRLAEAGISPSWRGENISLSVQSAGEAVDEVMTGWLNDPPHRDNILHEQHTHIGMGVAQRPEGWYVFVMDLIKK